MQLPGDELNPTINDAGPNNVTNREQQINQLVQQRDIVHQRLQANADKMKVYYDSYSKHYNEELQ